MMKSTALPVAALALLAALAAHAPAAVVSIDSDAADVVLRSDGSAPLDRHTDTIGAGGNPSTGRVAIFFFQLPAGITDGSDILAANFKINLVANQDANTGHVKIWHGDLWGIGYQGDTTPDQDWYFLNSGTDTAAGTGVASRTLLQDDFFDLDTPEGIVETDLGGDTSLLAFIQSLYDAGAGPGDYAVLRINPDNSYVIAGAKGSYRFHLGGGTLNANPDNDYLPFVVPVLELTTAEVAVPAPTALTAGVALLAGLGVRPRRRADRIRLRSATR